MEHARRLNGALAAVTAGIVGVIANLAAWFALHLLFARIGERTAGPLLLRIPQWESFDWRAAALAAMAAILIFRWRWNVIAVLGAAAVAGLALKSLS